MKAFFRRAIAALLLGFCGSVLAEAPALDIDIPPQALGPALLQLAEKYQLQILFSPESVSGINAPRVKGRYTVTDAVAKLIEGTPLTYSFNGKDTVVVRPPPDAGTAPNPTPLAQSSGPTGASDEKRGERVEVTGTRLKLAETENALPVNVYTHEDIVRSGQVSLAGFLNTLNEVSITSSDSANFQPTTGMPTVQLRGLPVGMTLTLLNGRRVEGVGLTTGGSLLNLDLIPITAIERVEVLPVGASAVYGGDALAGVVNIILRKTVPGVIVEARYGHADGMDDGGASLAIGATGDKMNGLALLSYSKRTVLRGDERAITKSQDYTQYGGPNLNTQACSPGNVASLTASPLPGLTTTSAGMPQNPTGRLLTPADFTATAAMPNTCSRILYFPLYTGTETWSAYLSGDYQVTPKVDLFGEVLYTNYEQRSPRGGYAFNRVPVPASNAFNPFGVAVSVNAASAPNSIQGYASLDTDFVHPLVGVRGSLFSQWDYELTLSTGRDHGVNTEANQIVNPVTYAAALASHDPATALNLFTTGPAASDAVISGIFSAREYKADGRRDVALGFVRGPLFELPAGSLDVIAGAEYNKDHYEYHSPSTAQDGDLGRNAKAFFGELRAPIYRANASDGKPLDYVVLTGAVRRDDYSDFGSANTNQIGLEVRPLRSLLLRAARSTAFKPPLLPQLVAQSFDFPGEVFGITDPQHGGAPVSGANIHFSANPNLDPEKGTATAYGAVWDSADIAGLHASINIWKVDERNHIVFPSDPQSIIDNEALLPSLVTRNAAGNISGVSWTFINFGTYLVEGVDYDISYTFNTSVGRWTTGASASQTTKYEVSIVPGSPPVDRLGHPDPDGWAPRWKGRLALGWQKDAWSLGATGRYISSYYDYGSTTRQLPSEWFLDLSAAVSVGRYLESHAKSLKGAYVSLSVVNAGNKLPRYASTANGYDTYQDDIRGRYFAVQVNVPWQ
jgi:iron complex outermembrane receptor protein